MITRFMLALVVTVLIVVPAYTAKWKVDNGPNAGPRPAQLGQVVINDLDLAAMKVACERRSDTWYRCPRKTR